MSENETLETTTPEEPVFQPSATQELRAKARLKREAAAAERAAAQPVPAEPKEPKELRPQFANPLRRRVATRLAAQPGEKTEKASKPAREPAQPARTRAQVKRDKSAARRGLSIEGDGATHMIKHNKRMA